MFRWIDVDLFLLYLYNPLYKLKKTGGAVLSNNMINAQDLRATDLLRILENISSVSVNQLGSRIATLNNDERTAYLDDIASRILDIVKQNSVQIEEMTSFIKCEYILKKYYQVITRHEASIDVAFSISNSKSSNNLFSSKFPSTRDCILDNEITKNLEPYFHQELQLWVEGGGTPENRENREIAASKMKEVYVESKTSLDLYGLWLTSLPAVIGCLNSLEFLYLNRNKLTTLPSEIGSLINLKILNLFCNKLTTLPTEIENLKKLNALNLNSNRFVIFPRLLCNITTLKHLEVGGNRLTALPLEIGNLKNLTCLILFSNALTVLPSEIGSLSGLSQLDISGNLITSLPSEIGSLSGLSQLDISGNLITSLPSKIGGLSGLIRLAIRRCPLSRLPSEIGNLKSLEVLDLYRAPLTSLPAEMGKLTNLKKLYVYSNLLETLPRSLGACRKLDKISSGIGNEILSEDLTNQAREIISVCNAGNYPEWTIKKAVSRNEDNLDLTYANSGFSSKSLDTLVCRQPYFQENLKTLCLPTLMFNQWPSSIKKLKNITILSFK